MRGKEQKPTVTWVTRCGRPGGELVKEFASRLSSDFEVHWLEIPNSGADGDWWREAMPPNTRHVFVHDADLGWVGHLHKTLKIIDFPKNPPFSLCYICDNLSQEIIKGLAATGADEIITTRETSSELLLRLSLRSQQREEFAAYQTSVRDKVVKEAKCETVMKQREEFLSVCAHDLRSPLGLIQSSLSMLLTGKQPFSELQTELLTRAKRQAGQAIVLVNDLLDVMAFEQGLKPSYRLTVLHEFLSEFYKDYSVQADQKNIRFHYDNPVKDWRVLIDPDRIRQLLQNLFTNALKFTESGKNIYLNAMPFQGRRKADPPYPMIVVSVKDEGKGIPQKEMERIFDRFTQIKDYSRADGRGLGLTVAKQISTLHDGNIWVQSVEGQGSTFFVLFPHVISRTQADLTKQPRKKHILVVTPNERDREKYFEILGRWGYELTFVNNGIEAITHAFYLQPEVILTTNELTKIDEFEVFKMLRKDPLTGNIPILYSAEAKLVTDDEAFVFYDEFLKLPISRESFQVALEVASRRMKERQPKQAA